MRFRLLACILSLGLSSCALFDQRLVEAKNRLEAQQYEEAIELLESYHPSEAAHKLLAEAYLGSGLRTLHNLSLAKADRYHLAKDKFTKAIKADPRSTKIQDYYQMILKEAP